jgi:tryptophan halogenase
MSSAPKIENLLIVGGGTAGWMSAAALAKATNCTVTLIESEKIKTVGVGEATLPSIHDFISFLGLDEDEVLKNTKGTFKLGIEFSNWGEIGDKYHHPFGSYGPEGLDLAFWHFWNKGRLLGVADPLQNYCFNDQLATANKFSRGTGAPNSPLNNINHAWHFDAGLFAKYLKEISIGWGVNHVEGQVVGATTDPSSGEITKVQLENGESFTADFFIDCSGFKGLLIEETLKTGYEDWSKYLPCDRAIAVQSGKADPLTPYTKAIAQPCGWHWRIPLPHRTGNGIVYSSSFTADEEAEKILMETLEENVEANSFKLEFTGGKRKKIWNKNCLSVGLASGFMEPLESTSIHLIQETITEFLRIFPRKDNYETSRKQFNKLLDHKFLYIRDFLVLHYSATKRNDSAFWDYCRTMDTPDALKEKIELWKNSLYISRDSTNDLFNEGSWLAVLNGQNITSDFYSPVLDRHSTNDLEIMLSDTKNVIEKCVRITPQHEDFVNMYCAFKGSM